MVVHIKLRINVLLPKNDGHSFYPHKPSGPKWPPSPPVSSITYYFA